MKPALEITINQMSGMVGGIAQTLINPGEKIRVEYNEREYLFDVHLDDFFFNRRKSTKITIESIRYGGEDAIRRSIELMLVVPYR